MSTFDGESFDIFDNIMVREPEGRKFNLPEFDPDNIELDSRRNGGLNVQLLWKKLEDSKFIVFVMDDSSGESVEMEFTDIKDAKDAYKHPYRYVGLQGVQRKESLIEETGNKLRAPLSNVVQVEKPAAQEDKPATDAPSAPESDDSDSGQIVADEDEVDGGFPFKLYLENPNTGSSDDND